MCKLAQPFNDSLAASARNLVASSRSSNRTDLSDHAAAAAAPTTNSACNQISRLRKQASARHFARTANHTLTQTLGDRGRQAQAKGGNWRGESNYPSCRFQPAIVYLFLRLDDGKIDNRKNIKPELHCVELSIDCVFAPMVVFVQRLCRIIIIIHRLFRLLRWQRRRRLRRLFSQ